MFTYIIRMQRVNALSLLMRGAAVKMSPSLSPVRSPSPTQIKHPFPTELHSHVFHDEHALMFDGGSRGNPGPCGAGAVLYKGTMEIWCDSVFVSEHDTNNFAEYCALNIGLSKATELGIKDMTVFGDSQLIINQLTGKAKVRSPTLIPLYRNAVSLLSWIPTVRFMHIKRKLNQRADALANEAMDAHSRS